MERKAKIILVIAAAILSAIVVFLYWKATYVPKRKIVIRKSVAAKEITRRKQLPSIKKKFGNPRVAIVMDDFGYNMNDLNELFAVKKPITFSILPNLPYSSRVASLARSKGYEMILHLPLESNDKSAPTEKGTIKTGMNKEEVISMLEKDMKDISGLRGVSNHQGSKATEDKNLMALIMEYMKNKKLYFFDSLVTNKSICRSAAKSIGIPYAKRDIFLDNTASPDYIEKQVLALRRFAFRKGSAIAICHDRKNTIAVLSKMMPELSDEGIVFVFLSDMVK